MIISEILSKKIKFNKDSKLLIGIGDSFCAGTGTESLGIWKKNKWDIEKMRSDKDGVMEAYDNSFINVLTKKYLKDYTSINLGMAGKGNRFAIRELFSNPQINLEDAGEKIVIFVSSGLERMDFSKDIINSHEHTSTVWPSYGDSKQVGYGSITFQGESIYSEKLVVGEFLMDMYMLINWCTLNNAKLLFISGFTSILERRNLIDILLGDRDETNTDLGTLSFMYKNACLMVNKIPWHRQIKPMGYDNMIDLMLHKQGRDELISNYNFRKYNVEKHTEKDYISKCQHPTKIGHELIADIVIKYIENYKDFEPTDFTSVDKKYLLDKNKLL
jgi:hypothetical protein